MTNDIKIDFKTLRPKLKKVLRVVNKHATFVAILLTLLAYVFVVWRISHLATADPSPDAQSAATASTSIPKVDKKAIQQIQSLAQNNTEVQSLFENARNNPFQE